MVSSKDSIHYTMKTLEGLVDEVVGFTELNNSTVKDDISYGSAVAVKKTKKFY